MEDRSHKELTPCILETGWEDPGKEAVQQDAACRRGHSLGYKRGMEMESEGERPTAIVTGGDERMGRFSMGEIWTKPVEIKRGQMRSTL